MSAKRRLEPFRDTANGRVVPKGSTNLELRGEDVFDFSKR
jgi:hypothetical protein